jgi:predicted metalloprotease with PDZ domain
MYSIEQRDEQLVGTRAAIRYHCYFDRAAEHLLRVRMEIDWMSEDALILVLPSWAPGSYKIRDFISHVGNLRAYDEHQQPLPIEWVAKNRIRIGASAATTVTVEYLFYANERTVRTMHITRWRAFLFPVNCLFYVEGRTNEIHHVLLYYDRSQWQQLTTALSPVEPIDTGKMPVVLGALNYDILADSPTEIGNHQVRTFDAYGARHEVALIAPLQLNIDWLAEQCKTIVQTEAALFGGVPYDRYVFFVYAGANLTGGLEHARCSVNMCDVLALTDASRAKSLLALLCHEYFHVWNVKRIRPKQYGPFDYEREVYSPMLWLAEGFTSYYDDLMAYRAGFYSQEEYLDLLVRDHLGKLLQVPGRHAMNVRDSSYLAWVKLYAQSPDGHNRFPSYYLKGGVLAMLLDLAIIAETDGKRRLDDVLRVLWQHYCRQPEQGVSEDDVLDAIEHVSSAYLRTRFWEWLSSTDDPDFGAMFEPFGIEWVVRPALQQSELMPPPRRVGLQLKSEGGRLLVSSIEDGSVASRAGIAVDDEILAVGGIRVTTPEDFARALQLSGDRTTITASCDGKLYATELDLPYVHEYELRKIPAPTERQQRLFARWLERTNAV